MGSGARRNGAGQVLFGGVGVLTIGGQGRWDKGLGKVGNCCLSCRRLSPCPAWCSSY